MSNDKVYNILIVGVGGQGIILASDVLGKAAALTGWRNEEGPYQVMFVLGDP